MGIICLTVITEPTHPGTVSPMDVRESKLKGHRKIPKRS